MIQRIENRPLSPEKPTAVPELSHLFISDSLVLLQADVVEKDSALIVSEQVKKEMAMKLAAAPQRPVLAVGRNAYDNGMYAGCLVTLRDGVSITRIKYRDNFYFQIESYDVMFFEEPVK